MTKFSLFALVLCLTPLASAVVENPELRHYESAKALEVPFRGTPARMIYGWHVLSRDSQANTVRAELKILVDNPRLDGLIQIVGPFNNWGKNARASDFFHPVPGEPQNFGVVLEGLKNGTPYRLLVNGQPLLDPTASMYTTREYAKRLGQEDENLHSVFWDVRSPQGYQMKSDFVDIAELPNMIGEVELQSLVAKYVAKNGQVGPGLTANTYRFIAESGVVETLKQAGYVAIEMLPFNQSIDGDSWHLRYQSYGLFAPDSRYGNPTEFKYMIDTFHKNGLAVIMDSVVSHWPYHGNKAERELAGLGMDQWIRANGDPLYKGPMSPWDTYRYVYSNPFVAEFLIDSVTHMMTEYKIDGLRMDNIDGIIQTPGGADFLKRLLRAAREVNPRALIIAESFDGHSKLLYAQDYGGWGFNTKTDSNAFDIWKRNLIGSPYKLEINKTDELMRKIWDWEQAPILRYLTNHDESANPRQGFTGQYPATLLAKEGASTAFKKIKAADSLSMLAGAYHVSLPQARMMQTGSFYSNAAIDWALLKTKPGFALWTYFSSLSRYVQEKAAYFNFRSLNREIANHVQGPENLISFKRQDPVTGKALFVLINLGPNKQKKYTFGVDREASFRVGFDSELADFGGGATLKKMLAGADVKSVKDRSQKSGYSMTLPFVEGYSVTILEER